MLDGQFLNCVPGKWLATTTRPLGYRNSRNHAVGRHSSLFPRHQNPPSQLVFFASTVVPFFNGRVPIGICNSYFSDCSNRSNSPFQQERYHLVADANLSEAIAGIRPTLGIFTLTIKAPSWRVPANGYTTFSVPTRPDTTSHRWLGTDHDPVGRHRPVFGCQRLLFHMMSFYITLILDASNGATSRHYDDRTGSASACRRRKLHRPRIIWPRSGHCVEVPSPHVRRRAEARDIGPCGEGNLANVPTLCGYSRYGGRGVSRLSSASKMPATSKRSLRCLEKMLRCVQ